LRYADTVIEKVEEWFDLVLITDRIDESLLLLKGEFIYVCLIRIENIKSSTRKMQTK